MFEYTGTRTAEKKIWHMECAKKENGCSARSTIECFNPDEITFNKIYSTIQFKKINFNLESFKRSPEFAHHTCNGFDIENPRLKDSDRDKFLKKFELDKLLINNETEIPETKRKIIIRNTARCGERIVFLPKSSPIPYLSRDFLVVFY